MAGEEGEYMEEHKEDHDDVHQDFLGKYGTVLIFAVAALVVFSQVQLYQLNGMFTGASAYTSSSWLPSFGKGDNTILGPGLKADGTSGVREYPTISDVPNPSATGDAVQDALNKYVPTGTPWYGQEAGVSFDDPLGSLNKWGQYDGGLGGGRFHVEGVTINEKDLSPAAQERYRKLINLFTCDFCCGSPQNPTRIGNCGCSHSAAWRGIFKFFLKNYENKFTDEQLMGEATRWKTLWYPGPTVKKILSEGSSAEQTSLDQLPSMVGGC